TPYPRPLLQQDEFLRLGEVPGGQPGEVYTRFMIPSVGWAYLVVVLDWYTRKIVGCTVDLQSKSGPWLGALDQAANQPFPVGVRDQGLHRMSDNGAQPTSVVFLKACAACG
ncbi:MAG: transposase, partial [Desulfurivibrio sp.]